MKKITYIIKEEHSAASKEQRPQIIAERLAAIIRNDMTKSNYETA